MMNRAHAPAPTPSVRRSLKKARVSQSCAVTRHAVTACDQAVAFVQIAEHCIEIVCRPRLYSIAAELAATLSGSPVSSECRTIEMGTKGRFRLTLSRFHFARPVVASGQLLPTGERPRCSALSVRRRNRFGSLKLRQDFRRSLYRAVSMSVLSDGTPGPRFHHFVRETGYWTFMHRELDFLLLCRALLRCVDFIRRSDIEASHSPRRGSELEYCIFIGPVVRQTAG